MSSNETGISIGGDYCASCGKRIWYRVDVERNLNIVCCGCGERAGQINPSLSQVFTTRCISCAALTERLRAAEAEIKRLREALKYAKKKLDRPTHGMDASECLHIFNEICLREGGK